MRVPICSTSDLIGASRPDGPRTRRSGLIRALQQMLPESAREYVYVGATVQDITDTWFAPGDARRRRCGVAGPAGDRGHVAGIGSRAPRHADGRTDPRAAGCADHVRLQGRVLGRRGPATHSTGWRRARPRWLVGQLGGAVGAPGLLRSARSAAARRVLRASSAWPTRASPG